MQNIRDAFLYNSTLNKTAYWLSPFIGLGRISVHTAFLAKHVFGLFSRPQLERAYCMAEAYADLRGIVKGLIELPPLLGSIGSWYIDHFHLSPAQQMAYRVQEIYQSRLSGGDRWIEEEKDLVDVDPEMPPYNDPGFLDFINHQQVKVSTDKAKIQTLIEALDLAEVDHPIFEERKLPFYALAAFAEKKIDRDDLATMLHFYTAKQTFRDCKLHKMFDPNGLLSDDGCTLVGSLRKTRSTWLGEGTTNQYSLIHNLKQLPQRKQIYWSHEALTTAKKVSEIEKSHPLLFIEMLYSPIGSLYAAGASFGAVWYDQERELGLPITIERVFFNAKYAKDCDPLQARLGTFSAQDITQDVEEHKRRLAATFFPGVKGQVNVHHSLELPTTVIAHDKAHAHILQQYPERFLDFMAEIRKDFRELTGYKMSKEIWELIELVAPFQINYQNAGTMLSNFINNVNGRIDELFIKELFWNLENPQNPEPTPLLLMMLLKLHADNSSPFHTLAEDNPLIVRAVKQHALHDGQTMKQKIWILQQLFRKESIQEAPDAKLKFVKVAKGRRKNTVVLQEVQ